MTASQHMVQANGLRFRTMVDGPPQADMFILLHGFPDGAELWSRQVDALAKAGSLAVAPDLRGYGLTDAPDTKESYAIDHLVDDVAALIKAFGRESAHVAGHDWGAVVAWFFAARHPEMTKTLTALSVGHPAALAAASKEDEDQQARSRYVGLFLLEGKAERVLAEDDYRRLRLTWSIGPHPEAVQRSVVEHFTRSLARPGRLTAALNYYRANLSAVGAAWEGLAGIGPIKTPTVLLWGDQDPALGRRGAEDTRTYMEGEYELRVLEGAGHWLNFDRPDEVSRTLTDAANR
ncbi:MAG TPA: alpha/beta hydrolase [Methylomirabilota bacterium]|nr:alpha/beta hydrolase [Methylomirabilota bacterium]